jgi:hypothetical protein
MGVFFLCFHAMWFGVLKMKWLIGHYTTRRYGDPGFGAQARNRVVLWLFWVEHVFALTLFVASLFSEF